MKGAIILQRAIKFLFPIPSIVIIILAFLLFLTSEIDGRTVTFWEAAGTTLIFYIAVVIPLDFIMWGVKKLIVVLKKDTQQNNITQSVLNTVESTPSLNDADLGSINSHAILNSDTLFPTLNFDAMEGHEFEYFCADLLSRNGYKDVEVTRGSGDQGIDIIAYKDGIKYGVQCKCYSSAIGNKAVQEAFSGKTYYSCHVAAVLTNRYFTKSAKDLADNNRVLLWDRDKLEELIRNAE